jgi:molybdopterin-guanine dinucleotide biosynthesis protein A
MTDTVDLQTCTLAILAGGRGSRMGFAKALLQIDNKPILHYLLDKIAWPGPTLLVTAPGREHPPGCELFDREAIDPIEQGPLRGILTALQHCRTPYLIVITVDMPAVRRHHLMTALDILSRNENQSGLMFKSPDGEVQPFPFISRPSAREIVANHVDSGKLAVHSLTDLPGFAVEPAPMDWPVDVWTNLNRPEEYASYLESR